MYQGNGRAGYLPLSGDAAELLDCVQGQLEPEHSRLEIGEPATARGEDQALSEGALKRLEGFTHAMPALPSVRVSPVGPDAPDLTRIRLDLDHWNKPEYRVLAWTALAIVHRVSAWAIGRPLDLVRVELPAGASASSELADEMFGAPQVDDADAVALVQRTRALRCAIVRDAAALDDFVASSPVGLLRRMRNRRASSADRVRALVLRDIRTGRPQAETIAERLHVSPRPCDVSSLPSPPRPGRSVTPPSETRRSLR